MTLQELYGNIGESYEHALRVLRVEKLVDKHIRKLITNGLIDSLLAAGETMDPASLLETSHAVKGNCGNLGLTAEPYAIDFDSALVAPGAGKADAVVSGVTVKEERKATLEFTIPYVTIVQGVVFKSGADITMDNLGDKIIGVQSGTTGQIEATDHFGEDHVSAYDKYSLAFQALQNGQIDCIMVDDMVGAAYVKQIPGLEMISTGYDPENFAFGFAKGNTALVDAFNAELQKLIDDGTIEQIILKWNE